MVLFAQTSVVKIARQFRPDIKWNTTLPNDDKFKEYTRYAAVCLNFMIETKDPDAHNLRCAMAQEWLTLAHAIRPSRKCWQIVPFKPR